MYLRERYPRQDITVVIAYDVRVFDDLRGLYTRDLPNPLLGMTSRAFAEVAAFVAEGLTNREIAAQLTIAEGTVGVHVVHILNKLGFHSRAQIAAWTVKQP